MTDELKALYDQLEELTPYIRRIQVIQWKIECTKALCSHDNAEFANKYFEAEEWREVWYCNRCDTRFIKEAQ